MFSKGSFLRDVKSRDCVVKIYLNKLPPWNYRNVSACACLIPDFIILSRSSNKVLFCVIGNIYVKYESSITYYSKAMANVKTQEKNYMLPIYQCVIKSHKSQNIVKLITRQNKLTLYHIMTTFETPEEKSFRKHSEGKVVTSIFVFSHSVLHHFKLSSANAFNFDKATILSSSKRLRAFN